MRRKKEMKTIMGVIPVLIFIEHMKISDVRLNNGKQFEMFICKE